MVFNLYLNAARPHAWRRFGATDIAGGAAACESTYLTPRSAARKCLFIIALIITSPVAAPAGL